MINPVEQLPVLLHDSCDAKQESAVLPIDGIDEHRVIQEVVQYVQQAVDLLKPQGAVPLSPTYTETVVRPDGSRVVSGAAVVAGRAPEP